MTFDLAGKTALVTGASAGIGREIARVLARDVSALVLVARRHERLDELAESLRRERPSLRVVVRAVDLNDRAATSAMLDGLAVEGLAIDVLINNAGFGDHGLFEGSEWSRIEAMLELNVVGATFLLHRLVPKMVARKSGAILNVGSVAGMVATPGMAIYGATKAYLNHVSYALRAELVDTGVTVTALCPGPVPTEFQEVAHLEGRKPLPDFIRVDAVECAEQAVRGLVRGSARVIPGPLGVGMVAIEALPKALLRPMMARSARGYRR